MVTVKRNKLIEGFLYYRVAFYMFAAMLIYVVKDRLFRMSFYYLDLRLIRPLYDIYECFFNYGLFALLGLVFIYTVMSRRYRLLTDGRSYFRDSKDFHKSYRELIRFYTKRSDIHRLDTSDCPDMRWTDAKGIVMGLDSNRRLLAIKSDCESNFLTVGPPGSGKTIYHAIPNCLTFEGSVVCVDIKCTCSSIVKAHSNRKILTFCPDSEDALRKSVRFDIFRDYHNMDSTDQKLFIENIANILIPFEGGESGSYFTSRARKIFRGVCHYFLDEVEPNADLPFIIHEILQSNIFKVGQAIENSNCIVAKELVLSLKDGNEKNMGGAYDTLTTSLLPYSNDVLDVLLSNKDPKKCVTIKHLDAGYDLYLQIKQEHINVYAPLLALIIQEGLMRPLMQRPDASTGAELRPVLFILDEFPRLSESMPYDTIDTLLSTLRSKKVIVDILIQNIGQLEKIYGHEGARAIMANCHYQIVLATNDPDSANYFSELFGKKWVLKQSTSLSTTESKSSTSGISVIEEQEAIYSPQDICDLPSENSMLVYFKGKHIKLKKLKTARFLRYEQRKQNRSA